MHHVKKKPNHVTVTHLVKQNINENYSDAITFDSFPFRGNPYL